MRRTPTNAPTPYDHAMVADFLNQIMVELRAADYASRHLGKRVHPELDEQVNSAIARRGAVALVATATVDRAESGNPDYQTARHKLAAALGGTYAADIELLELLDSLFSVALQSLSTGEAYRSGAMHRVCTVTGVLAGDVREDVGEV